MSRRSVARRGVVLPTALLLLLALAALVYGSVAVAGSLVRGGDEAWHATQARRAATAAAGVAAGSDPLRGWTAVVADQVQVRIATHALSAEVTLVAASARSHSAQWWSGRLVWTPDAVARATADPPIRVGGRLVTHGPLAGAWIRPGRACSLSTPSPSGGTGDRSVRLGPLDLAGLAARLPHGLAPGGACPGGCPGQAAFVQGGLQLAAGAQEGLLVVDGDLVLRGDASWSGTVLVDGDLTVSDHASVRGSVQVTGDLHLHGSGSVSGDVCTVLAAWRGGLEAALGSVRLERRAWPLWGPVP